MVINLVERDWRSPLRGERLAVNLVTRDELEQRSLIEISRLITLPFTFTLYRFENR